MRSVLTTTTLVLVLTFAAACSGDESATAAAGGVRLVSASDASAIIDDPASGVAVLDIRTPAEFDAAHLGDATLLDFYESDFADRLADLDKDVPYVLYCRSGNRSALAAAMMDELGFSDVAEIDGGILAWAEAGLPLVAP
jgi:rhodanese-related sulfurtransferase